MIDPDYGIAFPEDEFDIDATDFDKGTEHE